MEYSNPTTKEGLIQSCEFNLFGDDGFGKISGNTNRKAIFNKLMNEAYGRYVIIALMSDNSWQFDDNNYTDFPIATTNLIANQADYTLTTDQIIIQQVEVLDPTGQIWLAVPEGDERKFAEYHLSESQYYNNVAAVPIFHLKKGNSIVFMPTPSYSVTQGLKLRFKRPPSYFAKDDTTKVPGFNQMHHDYLSDYASWKYAFIRQLPIAKTLREAVDRWEQTVIPQYYQSRSSEHPVNFRPRVRSSR